MKESYEKFRKTIDECVAVAFDSDGTCISSEELHRMWMLQLSSQMKWDLEVNKEVVLFAMSNAVEKTVAKYGRKEDSAVEAQALFEKLQQQYPPTTYEGVPELIHLLKPRKLGLITNAARGEADTNKEIITRAYFTYCQEHSAPFSEPLDMIVCKDDVKNPKPHPEPLLTFCERVHAPASKVAYIGDAKKDVDTGKAAGTHTVLLRTTNYSQGELDTDPDYCFKDINEVCLALTGQ